MKIELRTSLLQTLVAKAMKGASMNKMVPLTSLMAIELKQNRLTIITTDASNYLYVQQDKVEGDDFYVVVQAEIFSKLISKLTCETVHMELTDRVLTIKGNGTYTIELPLDEEGMLVRYPDPISEDFVVVEETTVNLSTIKMILATAKTALAKTQEIPCYTGYYVGNKIIATDTFKLCGINIDMFKTPVLISAELMDLIEVCSEEKIDVKIGKDVIIFSTSNVTIYGTLMDCIDNFQIDVIEPLFDSEYTSSCKLSKSELLKLLDRLSLFVGPYDENGIYLTFTRDGVKVESKRANSVELLQYKDSTNFTDFSCCIDITMLTAQVKANISETVEIYYGNESSIKIAEGNVIQILALSEYAR